MTQIANYIGIFQVFDNPRDVIEQAINTYLNNFKSSTFFLNELTESFKFTNGVFQRNSTDDQILLFKEALARDINNILSRYFDSDSIVDNIVNIRKEETEKQIILHIELYLEIVVDGLSYKFENDYSVLRKGG